MEPKTSGNEKEALLSGTKPNPRRKLCLGVILIVILTSIVLAIVGGLGYFKKEEEATIVCEPGTKKAFDRYLVIVGGYPDVYTFDLNLTDGSLQLLSTIPNANVGWISPFPKTNPSFILACDASFVSLYALNSSDGTLTLQNTVDTGGENANYVGWNGNGAYAIVSNYGASDESSEGANVAVFPIVNNFLLNFSDRVYHYGNSVNPVRQTGSHPHQTVTDSGGVFTFVPDLGLDKIFQYILNENGTLSNNTVEYVSSGDLGDGPRHLAWHPTDRFVYVINEMGHSVDVYDYDTTTGLLSGPFQSISTLPEGWDGPELRSAEILTTPDGKFLYASNRDWTNNWNNDTIVSYAIHTDSRGDHLTLLGWTSHRVAKPRSFAIDPTGTILLVGSSSTSEIVPFWIDECTGTLTPTGVVTTGVDAEVIQIVGVSEPLSRETRDAERRKR